MEITQSPEIEKRERIPEIEMGELLSAFNHEAKAFTIIAMELGVYYLEKKFFDRVMKLQGERKGWVMRHKGPFDYCKDSLSLMGLVTQDPNLNILGYIKTAYGEETGVSFAGLFLKFSLAHPEHSLQDYFAKTGSTSKPVTIEDGTKTKRRAPLLRLKIFQKLATLDMPISDQYLVNQLVGESASTVRLHINVLAKKGLVSYDVKEFAKPYSTYKLAANHSQDQPAKHKRPLLEAFIYKALLDKPDREWTSESMADLYLEETKSQQNRRFLKGNILVVFSHLLNIGYVERRKFSNKKQSEINLTPSQRKTIVDLVTILDQFQNKDPEIIKEGRDFADFLLSHPEVVSRLLLKAKKHSPNSNGTPQEVTEQMIIDVISSYGTPFDNRDIQKLLESNYRKILSKKRIGSITHVLSQQGKINAITEKGGVKRYGSVQPNSVPAPEETL